MIGAVEGGGTKFVCAVGEGHDRVVDEARIETRDGESTLADIVAFFAKHPIDRLGVGTFGPISLEGEAAGTLLGTPKAGWSGFPLGPRLRRALGVPVRLSTDVNASALAEATLGAAQGCDPVAYVTVGTGIGIGFRVNGQPLHGLLHAEVGHLPVPVLEGLDGTPDDFVGICPFHGRCLEGVASGSALAARLGHPADQLPDEAPIFELCARYVGFALASVVLVASPQRIVVGGGVGSRSRMLPIIRKTLSETLAGYVPAVDAAGSQYVVAPGLGARSGIVGAFLLAAAVED